MKKILMILLFIITCIFHCKAGFTEVVVHESSILSTAVYDSLHIVYGGLTKNEGTTYFSKSGFVLRATTDGGASWKTIWSDSSYFCDTCKNSFMEINKIYYLSQDTLLVAGMGDPDDEIFIHMKITTDGKIISQRIDSSAYPYIVNKYGNNGLICRTDTSIITSFDKGETWSSTYVPLKNNIYSDVIRTFGLDTVIAASWEGSPFFRSTIVRSFDGMKSWDVFSTDSAPYCVDIHMDFCDHNTGIAATCKNARYYDSQGNQLFDPRLVLYKTYNGGESWELLKEFPMMNFTTDIKAYDKDHWFLLLNGPAFYYTTDGGESWDSTRIPGKTMYPVQMFVLSDKTVYIKESMTGDILKWDYDYNPVFEERPATPLLAVPTPFTDEARIEFDVEQAGAVSVLVRNSMGELVAQREYYSQSGRQSFSLAGAELPAGIYFCDIVANGKTYRAKAVLVR